MKISDLNYLYYSYSSYVLWVFYAKNKYCFPLPPSDREGILQGKNKTNCLLEYQKS